MCIKPFIQGAIEYGCGQCLPCRFNRRRLWTSRLMLEAHKHAADTCWFITLTYNEEHFPSDGSVSVREAQLFVKRLREHASEDRLRYFMVGEYGRRTWRPHYHACVFGLRDAMAVDRAWKDKRGEAIGFVQVLPLTYELAQYIAGYVTDKMTSKDDPRLGGRHPEFARMSLRPGIGARAVDDLMQALVDPETGEIRWEGDVPAAIRTGGKLWPLGRYVRGLLRDAFGMDRRVPAAQMARLQREAAAVLFESERLSLQGEKRVQSDRRARVRHSISSTKRGL